MDVKGETGMREKGLFLNESEGGGLHTFDDMKVTVLVEVGDLQKVRTLVVATLRGTNEVPRETKSVSGHEWNSSGGSRRPSPGRTTERGYPRCIRQGPYSP